MFFYLFLLWILFIKHVLVCTYKRNGYYSSDNLFCFWHDRIQVCWKHPLTSHRTTSSRGFCQHRSPWGMQAHKKGQGTVLFCLQDKPWESVEKYHLTTIVQLINVVILYLIKHVKVFLFGICCFMVFVCWRQSKLCWMFEFHELLMSSCRWKYLGLNPLLFFLFTSYSRWHCWSYPWFYVSEETCLTRTRQIS